MTDTQLILDKVHLKDTEQGILHSEANTIIQQGHKEYKTIIEIGIVLLYDLELLGRKDECSSSVE